MTGLTVAGLLLGLLWLQITLGSFGVWRLDWSLCGLLVVSLRLRFPAYEISAMGLGLLRDTFSVVPLGAQALGMGITVAIVRFLGNLVLLENAWIQGIIFFAGYLAYQIVFFCLGKIFGFLQGGFLEVFAQSIPKAILAAAFCWALSLLLSRLWPRRADF